MCGDVESVTRDGVKHMKWNIEARTGTRAIVLAMALLTVGVVHADGQRTIPGYTRSDQSDVTGPAVTSGDQVAPLFSEPGTIFSMICPVAWGVGNAGDRVQTQLASAQQQPVVRFAGREATSTAQIRVLSLMTRGAGDAEVSAIVTALTANNDRSAQRPARRLANSLKSLLTDVERMDPKDPGKLVPTRLNSAVTAFNDFIEESSPEFLTNPPDEMTTIHSVLNDLVIASLENEDRRIDPTVVDNAGRACAVLLPPPAPAPPPPPVEQAMSMCVLDGNEFRNIAAIRRPEIGDTVVILNGDRQPLASVYPMATEVPSPPWVPLAEPVTIGQVEYQPFGVSRRVNPGELEYRGEHMGYAFFTERGEPDRARVLYFLAGPECEVQPYRSVETIRVRG